MSPKPQKPAKDLEFDASDLDALSGGATKPAEMEADELEFMSAINEYKRRQDRPFPSWSEVLEVLKALGYRKSA